MEMLCVNAGYDNSWLVTIKYMESMAVRYGAHVYTDRKLMCKYLNKLSIPAFTIGRDWN